jgi:hypothetical protein
MIKPAAHTNEKAFKLGIQLMNKGKMNNLIDEHV